MSMTDITNVLQSLATPLTSLILVIGALAIAFRSLRLAENLVQLWLKMGLPAKPQPSPAPAETSAPQKEPGKVTPPPPPPASVHPPTAIPSPEPKPIPPKLPTEYDKMWAEMQILPQHQAVIERDANKIVLKKTEYQSISQQNGVPWFVIGLIDVLEAGGGCKAHLHNGDPLEGRTIHVPSGRPPPPEEPPFTWPQSALDALKYEGFDKIKNWPLATIAGSLEKYNGLGYHNRGVPSPYLWSFSNQYSSGKYVKDGVYDPNAVSEQAGAMPMLKALMGLDSSIQV